LFWLFCGDGVAAAEVCCGVVGAETGRTTLNCHGEADVTSGVAWAACTFIVTSLLSAAWLTYGSRSLPIVVLVGRVCPCCESASEPDGPVPCMALDTSA
jgi:hypothetical protein